MNLEALRQEAEQEMRRKAPRRLDGADVAAKRRKTIPTAAEGGVGGLGEGDGSSAPPGTASDGVESAFDVSLERYEYAAPSAILSDEGATGFVVTCAFNREKSATKEALELLRPHLPHLPVAAPHGLRLN
eukprot:CAMPEP_0181382092 /NCGR_PEP_ID=MMETSP1106-20121128/20523_1 /TAXON_ID=81844 /ORGANISM="Mantoniella antarctica, Strain SL-175" /LENGTH=129 /DNA_ID=CAMNT_0023501425 /DNA_START=74 /DNA_END=460 /DNA_ORIENTATION=-